MTESEAPRLETRRESRLARFWKLHGRALLAALVVLGASVWLWIATREHENILIYRAAAAEAPRVRSDIVEGLRGRLLALRALARRWENRAPDPGRFQAEADSVLRLDLQFRGIQWLDPDLRVRWSMPVGGRLHGAPLDSSGDAIRIDELRALLTEADPTISRSFPLPDAPRQILFCAPLRQGERVSGYLLGVTRATDLIDALVREPVQRGYSVQVNEGVFHVYGPVWLEGGEESTFGKESELKLGDLEWKVMVWPSAESLGNLRSALVHGVLVMGILLAILVGVVIDRGGRRRHGVEASTIQRGSDAGARDAVSESREDRVGATLGGSAEREETPGPV